MIIRADARYLPLADSCVHCCVTSPPYWGLRKYPDERQIGLEPTPEAYVQSLVQVFREVWRVLRDDGTVWLNLGDSYAAGGHGGGGSFMDMRGGDGNPAMGAWAHRKDAKGWRAAPEGLKQKDLVGIPWRVALALQADGWYLRSDIIWSKPNPMPESVTDRPTKAHEYLFLLAKSERYYYDAKAIAEPASPETWGGFETGYNSLGLKDYDAAGVQNPSSVKARIIAGVKKKQDEVGKRTYTGFNERWDAVDLAVTRNRRSVWSVPTMPYAGAHFATMPEALVEPCILAGCPMAGKRCDCDEVIDTPLGSGDSNDPTMQTGRAGFNRTRRPDGGRRPITRREQRDYAEQMRSSPFREEMAAAAGEAFAHYVRTDKSGARPLPPDLLREWLARDWLHEPAPCCHPIEPPGLVLDPFCGTGTVLAVAARTGRRGVGIDLSYQELAKERTAQRGLMFGASASC